MTAPSMPGTASRTTAEVGVLGSLQMRVDGAPVALGGAARRGFIARLVAANNEIVSLDELTESIWPNREAVSAVGTMRNLASQLRRHVGQDTIRFEGNGYLLELDDEAVDVRNFERVISTSSALAPLERKAELDAVLASWRGPAYVEFVDFEWARNEQDRIRALKANGVHARIDACLVLGENATLVSELEVAVVENSYDERLWAQLMTAQYRCGRTADAINTFQRVRKLLSDELGIVPGPELRALEVAILDHDPRLRTPSSISVVATEIADPHTDDRARHHRVRNGAHNSQDRDSRSIDNVTSTAGVPTNASDLRWIPTGSLSFVGRAQALTDCIEAVTNPSVKMVIINGDAGVGKTRFIGEVARIMNDLGTAIAFGRCDEFVPFPYQVFREMSRSFSDSVSPRDSRRAATANETDLWRSDHGDRERLFQTVLQGTREATTHAPLMAVVDDLQWIDAASAEMLRYLVTHANDFDATIVASSRTGPEPNEVIDATATLLRRIDAIVTIDLDGLEATDVEQLVFEAAGEPHSNLAVELWTDTGGNSLFVTEILKTLDFHSGIPDRAQTIPTSVHEALRDRMRILTPQCVSVLRTAAIVGFRFDLETVASAATTDIDAAAHALDEAIQHRFATHAAPPHIGYEFTHAVVRDCVLLTVPPVQGAATHQRAASAIGKLVASGRNDLLRDYARHLENSNTMANRALAITAHRQAADYALRRLGPEHARHELQSALTLLNAEPNESIALERERCDILLLSGAIENQFGDVEGAKRSSEKAAQVALALGDPDRFTRAALAHGGLLPTGSRAIDPVSTQLLRQALDQISTSSIGYPLVATRYAHVEYWNLDRQERTRLCETAILAARERNDPYELAHTLLNSYNALQAVDTIGQRELYTTELEAIARRTGDRTINLRAVKCRLEIVLEMGDFNTAGMLATRLRTEANDDQPEYERLIAMFDAMQLGLAGNFDAAQRTASRAYTIMKDRGQHIDAFVAQLMGRLSWDTLRGDFSWLLPVVVGQVEAGAPESLWAIVAATAHIANGNRSIASEYLEQANIPQYLRAEPRVDWWAVIVFATIVAGALGDEAIVASIASTIRPYADYNTMAGMSASYGAVSHFLGVNLGYLGEFGTAREYLYRALDRHRRMNAHAFVTYSEIELAVVLAQGDADDRADARNLVDSATQSVQTLGLHGLSRRLDTALELARA